MRTELKAGLIVGLIVIGGVAFYVWNRGSGKADSIPFQVKSGDAGGGGQVDLAGAPGKPSPGAAAPGKPSAGPQTPAKSPSELTGTGKPAGAATPPPKVTEHPTSQPAVELRPGETTSGAGAPRSPTPSGSPPLPPIAGLGEGKPGEVLRGAGATTQPATRAVTLPPPDDEEPGEIIAPSPRVSPAPAVTPTTKPATDTGISRGPGVPIPPRPGETPADDRSTRLREAPKPEATPTRYTVQSGDTLSSIAREHFGDARYWTRIRDANPDIDPDRLREGQVIVLPPKEGIAAATTGTAEKKEGAASGTSQPKADQSKYVVAKGDTLMSIARERLGNASRWKDIYDLNRDKIQNPDRLLEGIELRLPAAEPKEKAKENESKDKGKAGQPKEKAKAGEPKDKGKDNGKDKAQAGEAQDKSKEKPKK
jgi:nucleoid-associated protein YgaU